MKNLFIIIFVLLTGCTSTQKPELTKSKGPDISIHKAASQGNIQAIKDYIANGADLNSKDESGWTPLHWATSKVHNKAASQGNIQAIKDYIANGADLNSKDESGWTPLHWATSKVHNKAAKILISEGANVNIVNKDGLAPLDYAENELFGVLIDNGAKSGAQLQAESN